MRNIIQDKNCQKILRKKIEYSENVKEIPFKAIWYDLLH